VRLVRPTYGSGPPKDLSKVTKWQKSITYSEESRSVGNPESRDEAVKQNTVANGFSPGSESYLCPRSN